LLAAAILATIAILILFLWLQRQEHLGQLQETERNALRESEERFRALTEQSTVSVRATYLFEGHGLC
jgi:C4-dicarboxylate-specific signal transduction histidine kinase